LLRNSEEAILNAEELSEISTSIKQCKPKNGLTEFLLVIPIVGKIVNKNNWSTLIKECKNEKINEADIKSLLARYDLENKRFKCIFK
jgi:hypothetical protein